MGLAAGKLRVLIPTTNGPAEILLLTEEDPVIGRSVACIGGTTTTADIAADYHAFVVRPTGVIEGLFGHSCYRLDVSARIDAGSSWQIGVLAAHALHQRPRTSGSRRRAGDQPVLAHRRLADARSRRGGRTGALPSLSWVSLVVLDDKVQIAPAGGRWPTHDMPRLHYAGTFDPGQIPGVGKDVRARYDVLDYSKATGPKAAAFHPTGRFFTVQTADSQHAAEAAVLSLCNADPIRHGALGPCSLYAVGDQVVLSQHSTKPLTQ